MVVSNYFPSISGYSTRLHGIASGLANLGHNVTILAPKRDKNIKEFEKYAPNITVIRYPFYGFPSGFTLVKRVHDILSNDKYDLISGHSPVKCAIAAYLGNLLTGLPFVFVIHYPSQSMELPKKSIEYKIWNRIDNFILNRANRLAVISSGIKEDLLKRKIPDENIIMLPNGVDSRIFSPQSKNIDIQKKYDLKDKKVILFLGKFQEWERLDILVKVFARIREKQDDVKLLLVGDGPERERIEQAIRKHNLTNDVIITGFVPFDETPKYYSVCDVFVMVRPNIPLTEINTPIKPIEAMAMEKVVISTDVGGMREIIEDGKTGFLVSDSLDAIVDMIIEVLNNPLLQKEIGKNARMYVERERNWDVIINNLANEYEKIIQEKNK